MIIVYLVAILIDFNLLLSSCVRHASRVELNHHQTHYSRLLSTLSRESGENMQANIGVRETAKGAGVYMWQIAAYIGISEPTLCRWMRFPLSAEKEDRILAAIKSLSEAGV